MVVLGVIVGTGSGFTTTVVLVESMQLVPLDTTTEYVVVTVGVTTIGLSREPVLHE
jgi:hypothetical protein